MATAYSKRDYELVASIIRDAAEMFTIVDDAKALVICAHIAGRFAAKFHADNPRFDMEQFSRACGIIKVNGAHT